MERFFRIFGRIFDQYGPVFLAAIAAIIVLIALVTLMRRRKEAAKNPKPVKNKAAMQDDELSDDMMAAMPEIDMADDKMTLSMDDDIAPMGDEKNAAMEIDLADEMAAMPAPDQLDSDISHQFDIDDGGMDELDDITIPKVGEAPPPKKSRFFSASWLHRDHGDERTDVYEDPSIMTANKKQRDAAAECARLAEIERNMLALRELYEAGLIAPEVYALKAREFAAQVR